MSETLSSKTLRAFAEQAVLPSTGSLHALVPRATLVELAEQIERLERELDEKNDVIRRLAEALTLETQRHTGEARHALRPSDETTSMQTDEQGRPMTYWGGLAEKT